MRQFIFPLILIVLLPFLANSQTWLSDIDLNVSVTPSLDKIDLFTNRDGNHVLLHKGDEVVYYLFSYNGSQVRSTTVASSMNEDERLAKVTGNDENVYVVYKKGGYIYTKKSTNAGQSWNNMETITMSYSTSNGVEVWSDDNGVHLVWSEDAGDYETKYRRLPHSATDWTDAKEVTDSSGDNGGFPNVTTSENRVHVAYTQGDETRPHYNRGDSKTRDKYSSSWQTPQNIFNDTNISLVVATSSKLHNFYYDYVPGMGQWHSDLYYKNRNLSSTSWSSPTLLQDFSDPDENLIDMAVSNNDHLHIVYGGGGFLYKEWNGSWSTPITISNGYYTNQKISANGNDIYIIWFDYYDDAIRLKQRDFAPLAPDISLGSQWDPDMHIYHPKLTITRSSADTDEYDIYRMKNGPSFDLIATINCAGTRTTWVDDVVMVTQGYGDNWWYKVKAKDGSENESAFSNTVYTKGVQVGPSINENDPISLELTEVPSGYSLSAFPNPFNPSTTFKIGLPEAGNVKLSVYNAIGQNVFKFNEFRNAGYQAIVFEAKNLNSGLYFYQLNVNDYNKTGKILYVK
jgi:hypothetical protein